MSDDMWTSFRQLHRVVETFTSKRGPEGSLALIGLEFSLNKHKPDFVDLLKNSVRQKKCGKNELDRAEFSSVQPIFPLISFAYSQFTIE